MCVDNETEIELSDFSSVRFAVVAVGWGSGLTPRPARTMTVQEWRAARDDGRCP